MPRVRTWDCVAFRCLRCDNPVVRVDMPGEALRARIEPISFGNTTRALRDPSGARSCAISTRNAALSRVLEGSIGIIGRPAAVDLKQVRALPQIVANALDIGRRYQCDRRQQQTKTLVAQSSREGCHVGAQSCKPVRWAVGCDRGAGHGGCRRGPGEENQDRRDF